MSDKYSIEDKRRLAEKIQKLKVGENLEKVKKIIFKENPDLSVTKNSSGIIFYFHNLTESTYSKLDKFLTQLDNKKMLDLTKTVSDTNDILASEMGDVGNNTNKYKLSTKERNIIKRKQYEKDIGETDDTDLYISENESDNNTREKINAIFVKKEATESPPTNQSKTSKISKKTIKS